MSFKSPQVPKVDPPANIPTRADSSVITAGLIGFRPNRSPSRSNAFSSGAATSALGRKPDTLKRSLIGGT